MGHERGAFTGAVKQKKGRFKLANGGSIFLDKVDDIPVELQVKLLRVLEERTFERVGGTQTFNIDVRELKNVVERLTLSCQCNPIEPDCLPLEIRSPDPAGPTRPRELEQPAALDTTMGDFEIMLIRQALDKTGGNKAKAADILGIPTSTLMSRIKKYGLEG